MSATRAGSLDGGCCATRVGDSCAQIVLAVLIIFYDFYANLKKYMALRCVVGEGTEWRDAEDWHSMHHAVSEGVVSIIEAWLVALLHTNHQIYYRPHPPSSLRHCSESARKKLKSAMSKLSAVSKSGGLMPNLVSQSTKGSDVAETKKAKGIDTEHNSSDGRQESPSLQDAAADSAEGQGGGASKQA